MAARAAHRVCSPPAEQVSSIEEILEDVRAGRTFIIVDDIAENGPGHLAIPAHHASPSIVNFMARYARGLICLAIAPEIAERLDLKQMPRTGSSRRDGFMVSIEARDGVTTGISAFDRARTIAVAIDTKSRSQDIVSPGHVFPVVVRDGGVLFSAGQAEAAVDLARISGLSPAAVVCQILDQDGEVMNSDSLCEFAEEHNLRIGTVADLITHRRHSETLIKRVVSAPFSSDYCGDVAIHVYRSTIDEGEHVALVRGNIRPDSSTLVRVHQVDLTTDILGWSAARQNYIPNALKAMAAYDGPSAAVFVHDAKPNSISDRISGGRADYMKNCAARDYGLGAQILLDLGVRNMVLLTSSSRKHAALEGFGLRIMRRQRIKS